jgi:hypothetical protein
VDQRPFPPVVGKARAILAKRGAGVRATMALLHPGGVGVGAAVGADVHPGIDNRLIAPASARRMQKATGIVVVPPCGLLAGAERCAKRPCVGDGLHRLWANLTSSIGSSSTACSGLP